MLSTLNVFGFSAISSKYLLLTENAWKASSLLYVIFDSAFRLFAIEFLTLHIGNTEVNG
jgi:hypothetical protein